jgi:uncharacterized membrane protein HdeD (DUF308 family)
MAETGNVGWSMFRAIDRETRIDVGVFARRWWIFVLLGAIGAVVGAFLVIDVFTAVRTLAVLAGLGLLVTGLDDLLGMDRFVPRWMGLLSGAFFVVAGILAISWPGVTLWAIAVVVGIGLFAGGVVRTVGALADRSYQAWWLVLIGGLLSVAAGLFTLVWPGATILVLGVLLGLRMLMFGITEIVFGLALRRLQ